MIYSILGSDFPQYVRDRIEASAENRTPAEGKMAFFLRPAQQVAHSFLDAFGKMFYGLSYRSAGDIDQSSLLSLSAFFHSGITIMAGVGLGAACGILGLPAAMLGAAGGVAIAANIAGGIIAAAVAQPVLHLASMASFATLSGVINGATVGVFKAAMSLPGAVRCSLQEFGVIAKPVPAAAPVATPVPQPQAFMPARIDNAAIFDYLKGRTASQQEAFFRRLRDEFPEAIAKTEPEADAIVNAPRTVQAPVIRRK